MNGGILLIIVALGILNQVLRIWLVSERGELSEEGKERNIWGKIILSISGVIGFLLVNFLAGAESEIMKWYWLLLLIISGGFQAWLDWTYRRQTREYLVSMIVLILGIACLASWMWLVY
ncbi:hypothetical protein J41TS12_12060 [Paenibacillus antibioticophila]|uniref:DUF4181 domain-containing protein n=1 Tax=Paenibacillus antibioticophila TaxID=1274374 RepID=A0A919XSZ1_9BACL|nr:DUF4181 domain-containing protein [Paenibacillus antibioticophila]GIO36345.1 hypothetical protein J41TS12_12060 [Paenibacillus antibioticophila]